MQKLSVVATPIGNLEDITLRALRTLKEADVIACEDTRVTKKLLSHFDIHTFTVAFHANSGVKGFEKIIRLLEEGRHVALVSDAGTPGVSDPGLELVSVVREKFGSGLPIEAIPGPFGPGGGSFYCRSSRTVLCILWFFAAQKGLGDFV